MPGVKAANEYKYRVVAQALIIALQFHKTLQSVQKIPRNLFSMSRRIGAATTIRYSSVLFGSDYFILLELRNHIPYYQMVLVRAV